MNCNINNETAQENQFKYQQLQMQGHFLPAPASVVLNKARTAFVDPIVHQNKNQIIEVVN